MKKIIALYIVGLVTYVLGNNWHYIKTVSETVSDVEYTEYQLKMVPFIPQWLPLIIFIVVLVLLIRSARKEG